MSLINVADVTSPHWKNSSDVKSARFIGCRTKYCSQYQIGKRRDFKSAMKNRLKYTLQNEISTDISKTCQKKITKSILLGVLSFPRKLLISLSLLFILDGQNIFSHGVFLFSLSLALSLTHLYFDF